MKINIGQKPKTSIASQFGNRKPPEIKNKPSWLMTRKDEQEEAQEEQRLASIRRPEVWCKDGQTIVVRFRDDEPVGAFFTYSIRVNGKWISVTKPPEDEPDLMMENIPGLRSSYKFIYEVFDRSGYVKKGTTTKIKDKPRFLVANGRVHKGIQTLVQRRGSVTEYDVEITRNGVGKDAEYSLLPAERSELPKSVIMQDRLAEKIAEYYAPPNEKQQRAYIRGHSPDDE